MTNTIRFTINSWTILVPIFLLFLLAMILLAKFKKFKYTYLQYTLITTFVIYLLSVIHLVLFPIDVNIGLYANQAHWYSSINFIPIITIDLKTFILNIVMLIPFGMYLPLINSKFDSAKKAARLAFIISLSIEMLQSIIGVTLGNGRTSDINDIIANTLGAVLGYILINKMLKYKLFKNMLTKATL